MFKMPRNVINFIKAGALFGGAYVASEAVYKVNEDELAVVFSRLDGVHKQPIFPGIHFKIPFVEQYAVMKSFPHPFEYERVLCTRDGASKIQCRILFHPSVDHLADIYNDLGVRYVDHVFPVLCNEVLPPLMAECYTADLSSSIYELTEQTKKEMESRAKEFHILVDDVYISVDYQ